MAWKSCFFIGHREAPERLLPALQEAVETHITEYGVRAFFVGQYGGFDRLAKTALKAAKQRHPEITLYLLSPYHPAERPIKKPEGFDSIYYPPGMETVPRPLAIVRANRYLVEHVDYLIAYAWHEGSNALALAEYALARERRGRMKVTMLERC